jgi:nucleoside-diphosphate-sugar epimerase
VLVTGAAGFVGRRVVAAAARDDRRLRLAVHRSPPEPVATGQVETVLVDLTDPRSVRGICQGVRVLIHCASHVGAEPEVCEAVNALGTRTLVQEAERAGVERIVYLSTAAVYGDGVYRQLIEGGAPCRPVSAASRTRLIAEQEVLRAGGTVLRPYLVYGAGDRWFIPAAVTLLTALGGLVDGGTARLSLIDVDTLATAIVAVATAPRGSLTGVYHANHPEPVELRTLCAALTEHLDLPDVARNDLTHAQALSRLATSGGRRHHLDMLAVDHWFDSSRIWTGTGCAPGPGFAESFARHAHWYRSVLSGGRSANPLSERSEERST